MIRCSTLAVAALLVAGAAFAPGAAAAAEAHCAIESSSGSYNGPCHFEAERGGSFSVERPDGAPILDETVLLSLTIVANGVGEVSGLTTGGLSSRWGRAERSSSDRACWIGADFSLCAY